MQESAKKNISDVHFLVNASLALRTESASYFLPIAQANYDGDSGSEINGIKPGFFYSSNPV